MVWCFKPDMIAVVTLFILQYLYASAVRKYLDPQEERVEFRPGNPGNPGRDVSETKNLKNCAKKN